MMATREDIHARLAAIDKKKADTLKALQERRAKLKAKLAQLERPTKSQRRLDARRKILIGAFVLEQMQRTGITPQTWSFDGKRFFEWLVRENDRAVFEGGAVSMAPKPGASSAPSSPAARLATADTPLNVSFADKDQAKALGAQWRPDQKIWVVPAGLALDPFKAWLG
jgi:hypothetical protein